jgi:hypothetical protein
VIEIRKNSNEQSHYENFLFSLSDKLELDEIIYLRNDHDSREALVVFYLHCLFRSNKERLNDNDKFDRVVRDIAPILRIFLFEIHPSELTTVFKIAQQEHAYWVISDIFLSCFDLDLFNYFSRKPLAKWLSDMQQLLKNRSLNDEMKIIIKNFLSKYSQYMISSINCNSFVISAIVAGIFSVNLFTAFGFLFDSAQNFISQKNSLCFGLFLAASATLIVCIGFVIKSVLVNYNSNPSKNILLY